MIRPVAGESVRVLDLTDGSAFAGMSAAWQSRWRELWSRRERRPLNLNLAQPHKTLAISITGTTCELRCAHCDGQYLAGMTDLRALNADTLRSRTSLLISGGSDAHGAVPLLQHRERILELSDQYNLNLHIGYQNPVNLDFLEGRRVTISLELIGDRAVAKRVFGLNLPPEAYEELYSELCRKFRVIPHLTVGLNGGENSGEERVIEFLAHHPPPALTFLVFRPTRGTPFEHCRPPSIERVVDLIDLACDRIPCDIRLGCMRPASGYRAHLDPLAWLAGARTVVMPERRFVDTLARGGIAFERMSECCSLAPTLPSRTL